MTTIAGAKRTEPLIPVGHPDFHWTSGADVQATWRRYGWVPLEESGDIKHTVKIITKINPQDFTLPI